MSPFILFYLCIYLFLQHLGNLFFQLLLLLYALFIVCILFIAQISLLPFPTFLHVLTTLNGIHLFKGKHTELARVSMAENSSSATFKGSQAAITNLLTKRIHMQINAFIFFRYF